MGKSAGEFLRQLIGLSGAVRPKSMMGEGGGDALCKKCDVCQCGVVVGFLSMDRQWAGRGMIP